MTERLPYGEKIGSVSTEIPGPHSRELSRRLATVESPYVTYLAEDFPIFWKEAFGSNVEDVDGNLFVDLTAAFGVANLGHGNPSLVSAASRQAEMLAHGMGDVHPPAIKVELLERLSSLFPEPNAQTLLCNGGAEAIEVALKTAALASGKSGVIAFEGGYHGLTYGTLAVGGQTKFREPFESQLGRFVHRAHFPRASGDDSNSELDRSMAELDEIVLSAAKSPHSIGAILLEPIQGRAGIIVPPQGWLKQLQGWSEKNGILLIADEIMTGFGRTGTRFACDREEVIPDLLCLGKGLSGMMPISACVGRAKVMASWPSLGGEALHTSTFLGHPIGCAVALASIEELEKRDLASRADKWGREILAELRTWSKSLSIIEEVRGRGLMLGIALASEKSGIAFEVARRVLKKGVIVLPSGPSSTVVSLTPPLTIGGRQMEWALGILREALTELS